MLEILFLAILGILVGVVFGLIPGLHPNLIALLIPFIVPLNIEPAGVITFAVSVAVSNTFVDFIPSMLLGAPDPGKELSVLPAHKMLMSGNGYDAVKLTVIGGVGSLILILALLPLIMFAIPKIYEISREFTYAFLIFVTFIIVMTEKTPSKRLLAVAVFFMAGIIGILLSSVPVDRNLVLFPVLSGLFGVSALLLSSGENGKIMKRSGEIYVSGRQTRRAVVSGSAGGILSGLLPGVGASEISSLASIDKNEKSFLITIGAVTISNTLLSMLAIWLISRPRSGIAVIIDQLAVIGTAEFFLIVAATFFAAGVSALFTLKAAKKFISTMGRVNYASVNKLVIITIAAMTFAFTGLYGLLLLATCTSLGIFAITSNIRRSVMMGVLILPTIIFYLPF